MKKPAIIGLLIVIFIACLLLHWQQVKTAEFDRDFRQNLTGTWLRELDDLPPGPGMPLSMRCTNMVAPDGSFLCRAWFRHADRTNTYQQTGTWMVKNGRLIQTVKSSTNPTEVTPWTRAGRIMQADARSFIVRWQNSTNESVWQKVSP
jgi:hypothetical protein